MRANKYLRNTAALISVSAFLWATRAVADTYVFSVPPDDAYSKTYDYQPPAYQTVYHPPADRPIYNSTMPSAYGVANAYDGRVDPRQQVEFYNSQTAPLSASSSPSASAPPPAAAPVAPVAPAPIVIDPQQDPLASYNVNVPAAPIANPIPARPVYVSTTPAPPPPQATPLLALEPDMSLTTRQGFDIGVQGIYYRYREPDVDVTELGGMVGFTAAGTYVFDGSRLGLGPHWFSTLDTRYAFGDLDYRGSGTAADKWNDLWEIRGLVGKDFLMQEYSLSPYTGLGFRELYDDNRGLTTTGAFGYRRTNQIYYLPLGIMPRMSLDTKSRLTSMFEYDVLLHGSQTSYLADGNAGDPDFENQQHSGFGIRANVMYETKWWSLGPYLNYWDIDQSKIKLFSDPSASTCASFGHSAPCVLDGDEPKNHTYEMGVQAKFHFF